MKLSQRTQQLLKSFSLINNSIIISCGSSISSMSPNKDILAKAEVAETFTTPFAIYDLTRFLGVLSLFKEPELEFHSKHVTIKSGKESVDYFYADPSLILSANGKSIPMQNAEIEFALSAQAIASISKALNLLQLSSVAIEGDRSTIKVCAVDLERPTQNRYEIEVGETKHDFRMVYKGEHFKTLSENYNVKISSKGFASFKADDVEYWVATQNKFSTFKE